MSQFKLSLLLLCMALMVTDAWAMRCGGRIVSDGDHKARVRALCGEPTTIDTRSITQVDRCCTADGQHYMGVLDQAVIYEDWTYNLGSSRLMQLLHFRNGILERVDSLGYGY